MQTRKSLHLVPGNIIDHASQLSPTVSITDKVIHVGSGASWEMLMTVPIGTVDPDSTITVTVGVDRSHFNTAGLDADPHFKVTDGTKFNEFSLVDINNYKHYAPCFPLNGGADNDLVSSGTKVPATFKFTFIPGQAFGYCETAQEGGYINTGKFNSNIDIGKPLSLQIQREHGSEQYYFHYILIEVF